MFLQKLFLKKNETKFGCGRSRAVLKNEVCECS